MITIFTCSTLVIIHTDTPAITLLPFRIYLFVILPLRLNVTGRLMVIFVEGITSL